MKEIKPITEHGIVHRARSNTFLNYHGWPSVCKDSKGTLFAAASGMRVSHVDPMGKNCMYMSFDEGKTWSAPIVINDSFLDDRDTGIIAWGDGHMLASWFSMRFDEFCNESDIPFWFSDPHRAISNGFGKSWTYLSEEERKNGAYVSISDDYGFSWSEPIRVPVTAPHGPAVTKDGTLIYMGKLMNPDYLAPNPICVYTSRDGGYNWEYTATVPVGDDIVVENMHEAHLTELPNGRLLGAIRIHERKTAPDMTVYTTYSDDKGKTWSKPVCIGVDGLPPHLMVHSSGAVICSYGRRRSDDDRGERACVSYDNGETWTEDYALKTDFSFGDHGYPASVELSDGSIMTVYYMGYGEDNYTSVLYTKWRLGDPENK